MFPWFREFLSRLGIRVFALEDIGNPCLQRPKVLAELAGIPGAPCS